MTPNNVLQLYCTHCTYGTSALHRNEGAIRDQVFEYSLRAGSVDQRDSHDVFRSIEPCLYFHLPADTPASEMRELTAEKCRWHRFIYYPAIAEYHMLARVCYRQTDTRGRPGSYFAHVLLDKSQGSGSRWSAADCLKLWGAPFWVSEDSVRHPYDLDKVPDLRNLDGYGAFINDDVLLSFLTTPAQGSFIDEPEESANCVIPIRWRKVAAPDRQRLLVDMLRGFLELDWERQERLVLAVEPSMAALLFYGIVRCLPRTGLAEKVSFSTYESHIDRQSTTLVACTFYRPETEELLPETYRSTGFVRNTYRQHPPRPFRNPSGRFAEWVVSRIIREGAPGVDAFVQDLDVAGAVAPADWEQAVALDDMCRAIVIGETVSDFGKTPLSPVQEALAGRILARLLENSPPEQIRALAAGPIYLPVLNLVGAQPGFAPAKKATFALLKALPKNNGIRNRFLKLPLLAAAYKGLWLAETFKKNGSFPDQLPALWEPDGMKPGGLVSLALDRLDARQAGMAAGSVPEKHLARFVGLVAGAVARDATKASALVELVKRLKPDDIGVLIATQPDTILPLFPPPQPQLTEHLEQLLEGIRNDVGLFHRRLDALIAGRKYLPRAAQDRVQAFASFRDAIKALVKVPVPAKGMIAGQNIAELEVAQDRLLDCMGNLFNDRPRPPTAKKTLEFLKAIMASLSGARGITIWEAAGRPLLARQVQLMNERQLMQLLASDTADNWLKEYPPEHPILAERLQTVLDGLSKNSSELHIRVPILTTACDRKILVDARSRVAAWAQILHKLNELKSLRLEHPEMFSKLPNVPHEVGEIFRELAEALAKAFVGQIWVNKSAVIENNHLISELGQGVFDDCLLDEVNVFRNMLKHFLVNG